MIASRWSFLSIVLFAVSACTGRNAEPAPRANLTQCNEAQLLGHVPDRDQIKAHRRSPVPVIRHAFGTQKDWWGINLTLRVDESGHPVCYIAARMPDDEVVLDAATRAELAKLRYRPFLSEGKPVAAIVSEELREEELPAKQVPTPQVALERVRIRLERSGCFGTCPAYSVEVRGDGQVTYSGQRFVDVVGTHTYRVPVAQVAKLVESLRAKNLWSLRSSYRAGITDNPTYGLTLDLSGNIHCIEDYVGQSAGMPAAVTEFEDEVDAVAQARSWIALTGDAVARLEAEHFDFTSTQGGELLARSLAGDSHDDAAMARLIELGASLDASVETGFQETGTSLVSALENQRLGVIEPLLARDVLKTHGQIDQYKLDEAFRAAIAGGRIEAVQRIWNAAGQSHPSLVAPYVSREDEGAAAQQVPVTLLLRHSPWSKRPWDGLAIVKWLAGKGVDLKAGIPGGDTLLHIAVDAEDDALVRFLLDHGLDPSAPGDYALPPLDSASDEGIALILLKAGARTSDPKHFARYARDNHWGRVVEWLEAKAG